MAKTTGMPVHGVIAEFAAGLTSYKSSTISQLLLLEPAPPAEPYANQLKATSQGRALSWAG